MDRQWTDVAEARLCGQHDGEAFALALQERDLGERLDLLTRLAWSEDGAPAKPEPRDSPELVSRLQREVEELAKFHTAVLGSRAWILVQRIRRLLGRAW